MENPRAAVITALLIAALTSILVHQWVWIPYRCNRIVKNVRARTLAAVSRESSTSVLVARRNLARIEPCLRCCPEIVEHEMAAAANYRLLGRFRDAVAMYQLALKFERRPEIYLNLGLTELEAGNRSAAIRYLVMAGQFDPHILTYSVPAPDVLEEVRRLIADQGKSRPDDP